MTKMKIIQQKMEKSPKKTDDKKKNSRIAVVRVRGKINLNSEIKKTFDLLNLHNKNWCVVVENNLSTVGMVKRIKDYVTWGEISEDTYKELMTRRGELYKGRVEDSKSKLKYNKYVVFNNKKYKKYIRLSPPRKGYGRAGVKISFAKNGALGYRADKINDLLQRMI